MTWSRRRFLTAAAPLVIPADALGGPAAPSNRITLGLVGIGKQGE